MSEPSCVSLWTPGRLTTRVAKTALVSALILLTVLGSIGTVLPGIVQAFAPLSSPSTVALDTQCSMMPSNATAPIGSCTSRNPGSSSPRTVGADTVPDLALPKTVVSTADNLGAGGVIQGSKENLTLFNYAVTMRLMGNPFPHDQLLGRDHRVLSSWSFWDVQVQVGQVWVPMVPRSNNFTILGTNTTGTFVVRTMAVSVGLYSGVLTVAYKATSAGPLKWDLDFTPDSQGQYRFVYSWHDTNNAVYLQNPSKKLTVDYGSANYTLTWDDIPSWMNITAIANAGIVTLDVETGTVARGSHARLDPGIIGGTAPSQAISFGFQRKVFYESTGGYYFAFYYNGFGVGYSSSQDGSRWSSIQYMPAGWPSYNDSASSSPSVFSSGRLVVVASGSTVRKTTNCSSTPCSTGFGSASLYYSLGTVSGSTINWLSVQGRQVLLGASILRACYNPSASCTMTLSVRYVSVTLSSTNFPAFSFNLYLNGTVNGVDRICGTPSMIGATLESDVLVSYLGGTWYATCEADALPLRSVVMPADLQGGVRVVYQYHNGARLALGARYVGSAVSSTGNLIPTADTYVEACCGSYDTNFASSSDLGLDMPTPGTSYDANTYIKFAPSLPAGSAVGSATLALTIDGSATGGVTTIAVFEPSSDWQENIITFHNQPSGVIHSSLSARPSVNLASYGHGATLTIDVSNAVKGFAEGRWQINYGMVLELVYNSSIPSPPGAAIFPYSQEAGAAVSPTLNVNYVCCMSDQEVVDPSVQDSDQFSAVTDASFGTHVVYRSGVDGNTTYAYRPPSGQWTSSPNLYPNCVAVQCFSYPSITVDYSTNDVYLLEVGTIQNQNIGWIWMISKSLARSWRDSSTTTVATQLITPAYLSSNFASVSGSNASFVSMLWTEGPDGAQSVRFASIPIQTVWSPFASPSDPWNGYGVVPYGQYFQNLGDYVSTSSGMLTVRQTDLQVPGRGLDLSITRVYTEPSSFLIGALVNYETYPWALFGGQIGPNAPWGGAWQLSFPWMSRDPIPLYIHLWDGEGYRIPSNFWTSATGTFENHQGEHFRVLRNVDASIILYDKTGTSYSFDPGHRLVNITDTTGKNTINFSYNSNNEIGCITDTLGRAYQFGYQTGGLLQSISQVGGSCSTPGSSVRTISYGYSGVLSTVTDPAGRVTSYLYKAVGDANIAPYLLSRITYPTRWYTNFTYATSPVGTEALSYRVVKQFVGFGATPSISTRIRELDYCYTNGPGGQVSSSEVAAYNGTSTPPVSFTDYSFSFAGVTWNVSDSNHRFLRGAQQRFGVGGEVTREIVLVTDGQRTGSYTNYYQYDLWGNLIYSRAAINSTLSRENFNAYYNNGLSPGFNAFQETFSQKQGNATDNSWNVSNGYWMVKNGVYNGTQTGGQQESVFAWSDINKTDISLTARVYITRQSNTTAGAAPRVGLFTHYQGGGTNKWVLVLIKHSDGSTHLDLFDEWGQMLAQPACAIVTGVWYTFNMTVQGYSATGWAKGDGQPACPTVTGTFSKLSHAAGGTGFGVYAGGYSALFDNIVATTVAPSITGTGFSNAFIQNGAPNSNVHGAPAGVAQLQNGAGSPANEAYYGFASWGGLNQTRLLYSPGTGTRWLSTSRNYDIFGNLISVYDPKGNATFFSYSPSYQSAYLTNTTRILRPGGTKITSLYSYNFTDGSELSSVDPRGYNTTYHYDILDRLTKTTFLPTGDYTSYVYNDSGNHVNVTNEMGWKTQQHYDGLGRLSNVTRFLNGMPYSIDVYTYNWQDKTITQIDPLGNKVTYQYDSLGRVTLITKPDQNTTSVSYNDLTSWTRSIDEIGVVKCTVADRLGRLISVVENATSLCVGIVTNYFYDETGNLLKVTTASNQSTSYTYDDLNSLIMTAYSDTTSELYTYDNDENLVRKTDRKGVQTSYQYDSLNRLTNITYYGSTTTKDSYSYDSDSNLVMLQSQNATLTYKFDQRNRVTCETYNVNRAPNIGGPCGTGGGGGGGSVAAGTLITLANGTRLPVQNLRPGIELLAYNVTTSQYAVSTITSMTTVDTRDMLIIQIQDGQPLRTDNATIQKLWVKQADGTVGWLSVTKLRVGDSLFLAQAQRWTMVTSVRDVPGHFVMYDVYTTAPYDYLANGYLDPPKLPSSPVPGGINPYGYSISYSYSGEEPTQIWYNDVMSVTYNYDGLGRVSSLYLFTDLYTTTTFAYYPNDQLKGIQYGNGLVANYTYNNLGLVRRETLNNTSTTPASSLMILNYQYNRTGTVASLTGQVNGTSLVEQYGYDVLRRLVNSYLRSGSTTTTTSYTYDNVGNRLSQKLNGILTSYNYNTANNELTRSASPQSTTVYGYDQNGQLTTKNTNTTSSTVHWTYRWDVPGNLLQPANDSGVQAYYAYDGIGRRLESVESPYSGCGLCRMYYAYLGTETLAEIQPMQSIENDYVYASGIRIARAFNQNGVVQSVVYYHQDALGSTRLVTSNTKTVLFADDYQPYGLDIGASGSETYRFTGKPVSQTTGLYYEYQRWYDPSIGRFISADPVAGYLSDPQSLNPYVYTENLPTGFIDPSGTDDCSINPLSWLGCASNAWNTLSPEEQQGLLLTGFVALTWATGGTDLLFVGGIFALGGVGLYADVTYAEGGTPTIAGALGAANLGFGLGTGVYAFGDLLDTGLSIGTLSQGERLAANRAAGLAFEGRIADAFDVTRNIGPGRLAVQGIETAGSAVPDFATGILGEAKYSNYVSLTRQIKILIEAASKTDTKELFLFTREDTRVSSNVWLWAAKYRITLYKIPWV